MRIPPRKMQQALTPALAAGALLLSACSLTNNAYFVKTDGSPATVAGIAELNGSSTRPQPLTLGVTFKSAGKLAPAASDELYQSVSAGLRSKGQWQIQRLGRAGDDFSAQIAAIKPVPLDTAKPATAAARRTPRLLVLVENTPDTSFGTQMSYFFSGMTWGAARVHKATDRYDLTIAYRDGNGVERVYRGHQDLIFASGSGLFGRDPNPGGNLKRYDTALGAFGGVVDNAVNGTRRGTVTVGPARAQAVSAATPIPPTAPAGRGNTR